LHRTIPLGAGSGLRRLPIFWACLLGALLDLAPAAPAASAERIPLPPLAGLERGAYRARDMRSGKELEWAEWTVSRETRDGRPVVHLQEEGREAGDGAAPDAWSSHMRLDLRGAHPLLTATRESRDADGRLVAVEERDFQYDVGSGQVVTTEPLTGDKASRSVRLTRQAITTELLPAVLRLLPEADHQRMRLDLVTSGGRLIEVLATVVGREWVQVPAGTFECFKVALQPTGLTGALASLKLAKLFMWHTVAAPHFWVKYEGPDDGAGSREIVRELVRFESQGPAAPLSLQVAESVPVETAAVSVPPPAAPPGRRPAIPSGLGYLLVLAAIVFEIGVEGTRLLMESGAPRTRTPHAVWPHHLRSHAVREAHRAGGRAESAR
jgi:hypothetical protein